MINRIKRLRLFVAKYEPAFLLVGCTASTLIWIYSNFAQANDVQTAKQELRAYVDQRHEEVKNQLVDIKSELGKQRNLQEKILLRVSH